MIAALALAAALSDAPAAAGSIEGEVDGPGVRKLVEARKGRPVVLQLWATWCAPCIEEFPALMAFARERADVAVVSVAIDDPGDWDAVRAFVKEKRPPFPVYLKSAVKDQEFIDGVEPSWSGVVPATIVYDASGNRRALLQGEHTRADIEKALKGGP